MMNHLTRFAIVTRIPNNSAHVVAQATIHRIIGIFGPPGILHPDEGLEFGYKVIHQLEGIPGHKQARTTSITRKGIPFQNVYIQQRTLCSAPSGRLMATTGHHSFR